MSPARYPLRHVAVGGKRQVDMKPVPEKKKPLARQSHLAHFIQVSQKSYLAFHNPVLWRRAIATARSPSRWHQRCLSGLFSLRHFLSLKTGLQALRGNTVVRTGKRGKY